MKRNFLLIVLLFCILVRIIVQYVSSQALARALLQNAGSSVSVSGVVTSEVYVKAGKQFFSIAGTVGKKVKADTEGEVPVQWTVVSPSIGGTVVSYGDEVRVTGTVSISEYGDPRSRGQLVKPSIIVVSQGNGNAVVSAAFLLKNFLTMRMRSLFSEPAASLAGGILIGTRSDIPKDVLADFKSDGLMHIVAVSGANMVIIINAVTQVLFMFCRRKASIIAIVFILFFTILVGPTGAVVRATIMASLRLVAWLIGRPQYVKRLFFLTGLSMIAYDPFGAVYDIGFQLSVAATAGLIWLATPITNRLTRVPEFMGLRENLGTTIAATLATTPVTLLYFQTFSYLAIPINLIVVPLVPWLMLGSFVSLFVGFFAAYPTEILFDIMVWIVHKGAEIERGLH